MQGPLNTRANTYISRDLPSPVDIRVQLDRIISSPEFSPAGHAHAFLRYVVEETLAGRGSRIKGYSIAIEVFDRDEGFTQDDPVVRIAAGRLRRTLERYYLVLGQNDPVRIDILKGRYVPSFSWNNSAREPLSIELKRPLKPTVLLNKWPRFTVMSAFSIAVCIAALAYWTIGPPLTRVLAEGGITASPNEPTLAVAPFAHLGEESETKLYALGLTEELLTVLPRFKEINVVGVETSGTLPSDVTPVQVRAELGARYLLKGGFRVSDSRVRITARILDTATEAILWSQTYDNDLRDQSLLSIQSDVANKVATAVAQPYGVIPQTDAENSTQDDLDAYGCTLRFYAYSTELSVEKQAQIHECLEAAVARYPSYATAWAMLSVLYVDEDRYGYNLQSGSPPLLERALQIARMAVELQPNNIRALQALMTALFSSQKLSESLLIGEQAFALNPNDTEFLGEFGSRLAMSGQWQRGAALLDQAITINPSSAGYYHGHRAFAAYMLRDDPTALSEIRQANLQRFPFFQLLAAIIYAECGMQGDAKREATQFVMSRPTFISHIEAELSKRNIFGEDRIRILTGIRKVGLLSPLVASARLTPPAFSLGLQARQ